MPFIKPPLVKLLPAISLFCESNGIECYIVGGYIRDYLLNRPTMDVDFAVSGDVLAVGQEVADLVDGKSILLDEENVIVRVIVRNGDEPWHLDFSSLHGRIEDDLKRRDLTINAMAVKVTPYMPSEPVIIDPYGGKNDLGSGTLRAVTDISFQDDPARLLRTIRLASDLCFHIESRTERLLSVHADLINAVAGERIHEELIKIAGHAGLHKILFYMDKLKILSALIPELDRMKGVDQPREHHWDVFHHSVKTVEATEFVLKEGDWRYDNDTLLETIPWIEDVIEHMDEVVANNCTRRQMLKFGALLHDIAKPATKKVDPGGKTRFLGHASAGADMSADILHRLRFSSREIKLVEKLVYYHLRPVQMANSGMPSSRAIYRYFKATDEDGIDILLIALADYLATYGPDLKYRSWEEHVALIKYILAERETQKSKILPKKLVNGYDVMDIYGLTQGPFVGKLLNLVHEAQATGEVVTREDALQLLEKELKKRNSADV